MGCSSPSWRRSRRRSSTSASGSFAACTSGCERTTIGNEQAPVQPEERVFDPPDRRRRPVAGESATEPPRRPPVRRAPPQQRREPAVRGRHPAAHRHRHGPGGPLVHRRQPRHLYPGARLCRRPVRSRWSVTCAATRRAGARPGRRSTAPSGSSTPRRSPRRCPVYPVADGYIGAAQPSTRPQAGGFQPVVACRRSPQRSPLLVRRAVVHVHGHRPARRLRVHPGLTSASGRRASASPRPAKRLPATVPPGSGTRTGPPPVSRNDPKVTSRSPTP